MGNKKLTIYDIAKATGYSTTTVSRALSGNGRVPERTKNVIKEYVKSVNYIPNMAAVSLSGSKSYNIGIFFPNVNEISRITFFQTCMHGIIEVLQKTEYSPLLFFEDEEGKIGNTIKRICLNKKVDAIILMRVYENDERVSYLKKHGIRSVLIGRTDQQVLQIDYNHKKLSYEAVLKLIKRIKPTSILYVTGPMTYVVNKDRYEGYYNAIDKLRIEEKYDIHDKMIEMNGVQEILEVEYYDIIICADEDIYMTIRNGNIIKNKIFILECNAQRYESTNILGGVYYDPRELGKYAAELALDNNKCLDIDIEGDIYFNL